jgi:solute carrier family 35 (UDP-sugar transporter), member A1/2/3
LYPVACIVASECAINFFLCFFRFNDLYFRNTLKSLVTSVVSGRQVLVLYLVPAFLYCLYNNLAFHNLATFDPTTYFILLQLRVVVTGVLFQIVFKKYLSRKQWISLLLLTAGCMVKQVNFGDQPNAESNNGNSSSIDNEAIRSNKNTFGFDLSINAVFILIQTICSCLAGVYNEYLLKEKGENINIFIQNVFMYLDSIICNALILLVQGNILSAFSFDNLTEIMRPSVLIVMFINCAIGITTSFFLKYMNSIIKTFASALELIFTAILCRVLFMIPIYLNTIISVAIVCTAVILYSQSPVVNLGKNTVSF